MRHIILFVLLASCSYQTEPTPLDSAWTQKELPVSKQKQRISYLQKKLDLAQKSLQKAQDEEGRLIEEVQEAKLVLIAKQIDAYERQIDQNPHRYASLLQPEMGNLFLQEREELDALIRSGASLQAQALLDRILRLITQLSDDTRIVR